MRNAFGKSSVSLAFIVLIVSSALVVGAGLPSYMTVMGSKQGQIKGEVTKAGREDTILVIGFSHEVVSPRDAASGLPTGKRQHKPIVITKKIDKSTPLLMNALVNNENLDVEVSVYGATSGRKEMLCYTIQLTNAAVAGIKQYMGFNATTLITGDHLEEVSFTYQKIIWTYEDGGITAEDDWETPVV